jgi:hypothetical protein
VADRPRGPEARPSGGEIQITPEMMNSAAFSPDGSRIVTASRDDRSHLGRRERQGDGGPARP